MRALPLAPLSSELSLDEPFTPAMAAQVGIGRAALERLHREGRILRIARGVYLDATVPQTTGIRARALALVVGPRQIVVDRTAAWLYGATPLEAGGQIPLDLHGRVRRIGGPVRFGPGDLTELEGVRCTTALRTALDVGRHLSPERALVALDGLLGAEAITHADLVAAIPRFSATPGVRQLRELAARADGRAADPAESVLRLRWYDARLPTPTPGLRVGAFRLALGLRTHRFGAVISDRPGVVGGTDTPGWRVLSLARSRILSSDPGFVIAYLEREFHLHLLSQVS